MERIIKVHLSVSDGGYLDLAVVSSVYEDRCYVDSHHVHLASADLRDGVGVEVLIGRARHLALVLGVEVADPHGDPWTDVALAALTKERTDA